MQPDDRVITYYKPSRRKCDCATKATIWVFLRCRFKTSRAHTNNQTLALCAIGTFPTCHLRRRISAIGGQIVEYASAGRAYCPPKWYQDGHYRERRDGADEKAQDCRSDGSSQPWQQADNGGNGGARGVADDLDSVLRAIDAVSVKAVNDDAAPDPKHGNQANETQHPKERRHAIDDGLADGAL